MRVAVIGTGHVGLVTCVSLAELGHEAAGWDSSETKLAGVRAGIAPFFEPGLEELLRKGIRSGRLSFGLSAAETVSGADLVFICVGTPPRADGDANLIAVEQAAQLVARFATDRTAIVEKSTVPTGTAARLRRVVQRERPDLAGDLEVVSNPEFLREGSAVEDALRPQRILVGAQSDWALARMRELYEPLMNNGVAFIETDIATAEMTKHACNAFLALKISFTNALARMCEKAGADVNWVADVMGMDPRIGRHHLDAGLGYGGSCFPKDLMAFERLSNALGYEFPLLAEIGRINQEAVEAVADKVRDALWNLEDKKVVLLGLAFKPQTDDVRFSPSLSLARLLLRDGARVVGVDPVAASAAKDDCPELETTNDVFSAVRDAHCLVLCTAWDEFESIDFGKVRELMKYPVLVDGRNYLDGEKLVEHGFAYWGVGRSPMDPDSVDSIGPRKPRSLM